MDCNLAAALRAECYRADPYPHYVVPFALTGSMYQHLAATFPSDDRIRRHASPGDNVRFSWSAAQSLTDDSLPAPWRVFITELTSQAFLQAVLGAFAPAIRARYPWLEQCMGPMPSWRAGLRGRDDFSTADVLVDAQICLNSPVLERASAVRGPHVDKPDKLFAGLFYMRPVQDADTQGGELMIQRCIDPHARFDGSQLDPAAVETVDRVPYAANMLVMFLNGPDALHAVTPRQPTPRSRYFVNLVGEVPHPLFDLKARQRPFRQLRRLVRRISDALAGRRSVSGQLRD